MPKIAKVIRLYTLSRGGREENRKIVRKLKRKNIAWRIETD